MSDITLLGLVSGRNKGEALLIDMASALASGSMPDKELSDRFVGAVRAMVREDDQSQRADIFLRSIGMVNPANAPKKSTKPDEIQRQKEIALDYWLDRLQGSNKGTARHNVAGDWQSGSTMNGKPGPTTVKRYVEAHPEQGLRAWRFIDLIKPSPEWAEKVKAEMQEKLNKNT